jgi:hypothetical protein
LDGEGAIEPKRFKWLYGFAVVMRVVLFCRSPTCLASDEWVKHEYAAKLTPSPGSLPDIPRAPKP